MGNLSNIYMPKKASLKLSVVLLLFLLHLLHHSPLLCWSLCVSTVLMIHVLIPLCQGPSAASITLCPCLLLALPALILHLLSPIKTDFLIVSNSAGVSVFKTRLKESFLKHKLTYFGLYQQGLSLSLDPCTLNCQQVWSTGESVHRHKLCPKFALWSIMGPVGQFFC